MGGKSTHDQTKATHAGRNIESNYGIVNPPVYHASTVLFPTMEEFDARGPMRMEPGKVVYGLNGTPTTFALEQTMTELEGSYGCLVMPSGLAAVSLAILAFVRSGDHILMVDTAYEPTRHFCDTMLASLGIETTYYDPMVGEGISELIRDNTRAVYLESPGSMTFEVQDVPAITHAAHARGCKVLLDNTWATPLFFKAFEHGVDVCIHASTKYLCGHSDVMSGLITTSKACYDQVRRTILDFGQCAGPDDVYTVLRGIRTLPARLKQQSETGFHIARWLRARPEVSRVLHPGLPDCPGHEFWQRDYLGASSLFGFTLKTRSRVAVGAMLDQMRFFKMGASWGGFESLLIPAYPASLRTATTWLEEEFLLRMHVGLEHPGDLITDLKQGLARLMSAD